MIQETINDFLEHYRISRESSFLVAVSGGADSISLLHAFKHLGLKIWALHCNFSLRSKESDQDEQFVKQFCEHHAIPHSEKKFDTTAYAQEHGISIEMAARELRYSWFREMKTIKKMDYIAVAHHADDVAETVLINLCRGTGIKGLTGIQPIQGDILRPLLRCSRTDILAYIRHHHLEFRTDSSNNTLDYVRNKLRHTVIPVFKEINPSFLNTLAENCNNLKETEQIFQYGIRQLQNQILSSEGDELSVDIRKTLAGPAPFTFLYETLKPFGFNKSQIRDILNTHSSVSGKQFESGQHILVKGRSAWQLYPKASLSTVDMRIDAPGKYTIGHQTLSLTLFSVHPKFKIPADSRIACLDADKIIFPLTLRNWQIGDYFYPLGMKRNKKKLSDYFTDQKFGTKQKQDCLLLVSKGEIAWVVGHRPDERFKITPFTQNILMVALQNKEEA